MPRPGFLKQLIWIMSEFFCCEFQDPALMSILNEDLRIYLSSLRYPVGLTLTEGSSISSQILKVPTFDIEIKHSRFQTFYPKLPTSSHFKFWINLQRKPSNFRNIIA